MAVLYLSRKEKAQHLKEFKQAQNYRDVDSGAIELCDKLNRISGVVVTQCCEGHMIKPHPEYATHADKEGYVSLRLFPAMDRFFMAAVVRALISTDYVTSVFTVWERIKGQLCPRHVITFLPGRMADVVALLIDSFSGTAG